MLWAYWRRVSRQALRESLHALSLDSAERAVLRIIGAVIGVAVVWWSTKGGTAGDLIVRITGTVAVIAIFPLVYLWKFAAIPPKIDKEAEDKLAALSGEL